MGITRLTPARCCCGVDPGDVCSVWCNGGTSPASIGVQLSGFPTIQPINKILTERLPVDHVEIDINDTYTLDGVCSYTHVETLWSGDTLRPVFGGAGGIRQGYFSLSVVHNWITLHERSIDLSDNVLPLDVGIKHWVQIQLAYFSGDNVGGFFPWEQQPYIEAFLMVFTAVADVDPTAKINCSRLESGFSFWHANSSRTQFIRPGGTVYAHILDEWDGTDDFWGHDVSGGSVAVV